MFMTLLQAEKAKSQLSTFLMMLISSKIQARGLKSMAKELQAKPTVSMVYKE